MGLSDIIIGVQGEREFEAVVTLDREYTVRSLQSTDNASIQVVGFGALGTLDGIEIAGVTPNPPPDYFNPATGKFPIFIIYGMAGVAAVAGIGFFFVSNRSLKNQQTGQQGIDPNRLVGYHTSASSGGYQTNRGEAQLKDDTDYKQTRNVYDGSSQDAPRPSAATPAVSDATCGCSASAEMGSECDCQMQSSCLCDATCDCGASLCRENADMMG